MTQSVSPEPAHSQKIVGLERMRGLGLPVPEFAVVPDFESIEPGGRPVDQLAPDWPALRQTVATTIALLQPAPHGYTLRSAASTEDTVESSSAGRFISFNGLVGIESICAAAVAIWRQHRATAGTTETCALILQATHCCYFGGVLAAWPIGSAGGDIRTRAVIESYYGSCRSVVDGLVAPFRSELLNGRWTHSFLATSTKSRFVAHMALFHESSGPVVVGQRLIPLFAPFVRGVRVYSASPELEVQVYGYRPIEPPEWYPTVCNELVSIALAVDSANGIDIEWGTSAAGEIALYQARPLTRRLPSSAGRPSKAPSGRQERTHVVYGLPAAPGRVRGRISTFRDGPLPKSRILFVHDESRPGLVTLRESRGVITTYGGMLSHIAIACRELGIPCVTGIGSALTDETAVEVDGSRGTVRLVKNGPSFRLPAEIERNGTGNERIQPTQGTHVHVVDRYPWLYDLSTPSGSDSFVHLPLIYATNMKVQHQAYAEALKQFSVLIDNNRSLQGSIVDYAVFRYTFGANDAFRSACLSKVTLNRRFATYLARCCISLRQTLPARCLAAEADWLGLGVVRKPTLVQLFYDVVTAITTNLANPFVESAVMLGREMFGGRQAFDSLYHLIIETPSFSHLVFFNSELERLKSAVERGSITSHEIRRFSWAAGFLGPGTVDKSPFESPSYVANLIGMAEAGTVDEAPDLSLVMPPEIVLDANALTNEWSDDANLMKRLLVLLRILQVNEEFRHYWQARVMRLLRLLAGSDQAAESRSLVDYLGSASTG